MHELSLAGSILDIVESAARRERFQRVHRLHLSAPALSGVDAEALRFALEAIAPGSLLEGAQVQIDEPAVAARCMHCGSESSVREHGSLCPQCDVGAMRALHDDGLRVVDLQVE